MNLRKKEMVALAIKKRRLEKGFTQKELSDMTNISPRSIQRIENGEVMPRMYTLRTIARSLDMPVQVFETDNEAQAEQNHTEIKSTSVTPSKIILSAGISAISILLGWAYTEQSARFPETTFELILFIAGIMAFIIINLLLIWRVKR
ncbi:hypothetical protein BEL04_03865 [Mucilaginibacter sp. PPCGB 2223]|uniref:helix-turn-helix domain-containing protein n=1 Tax=Mucilaginibacter sp. PPCGB 2223 TaxID=1886027 RepID=UPI00082595D9|nr:helix-turn-helix domain-containing protein [Mucilaginibacter sp. PPCGB 2223]OCX53447.1 hypothetical protein BEL04_03865 [Mucilaginibacter sp. PPCGB 2223]